eukprot:6192868-Alexandrium_andersonii.AAC.1
MWLTARPSRHLPAHSPLVACCPCFNRLIVPFDGLPRRTLSHCRLHPGAFGKLHYRSLPIRSASSCFTRISQSCLLYTSPSPRD